MIVDNSCQWCHAKEPREGSETCSEECQLDLEYFDANPHLNPFEDKRPDKVLQEGETISGGTVEQQVHTIMSQLKNFDNIAEKIAWVGNFDVDPAYSKKAIDIVRGKLTEEVKNYKRKYKR